MSKALPLLWYTALLIMILGLIHIISELKGVRTVDARTMDLCAQYASRDHSGEIGKERFEKLKEYGDPNDYRFFYNSCLNHVKCPTADECTVDNKYMEVR